jgi:hypothetical protein
MIDPDLAAELEEQNPGYRLLPGSTVDNELWEPICPSDLDEWWPEAAGGAG